MGLLESIIGQYSVVSVVGMGKNTGKTVTLNGLIQEAVAHGLLLGLTSIGRDGEKQDLVTMTEKPTIWVPQDTLVATASGLLSEGEAPLEILATTNCHTPLGEVVLARARREGTVQVAGPVVNREIPLVAEALKAHGAQLVLVDGAMDRRSVAAPGITEATILATGAVLSRSMEQVIQATRHQVRLFQLPPMEASPYRERATALIRQGSYGVIDQRGTVKEIPIPTALGAGQRIAAAIEADTRYVVIGGSLVTQTLEGIWEGTEYFSQCTFILQDATKLFLGPLEWERFRRRGFQVEVLASIPLLAVTLNPWAPQGYAFSPEDFKQELEAALGSVPVINYLEGEGL